ncbi:MAG TPA: tetratricopeptide repeat protein [Gemmatimonadales bacterium]|nr:tetratricopeptide repeat protein [Gemmatimonadales bacterium]
MQVRNRMAARGTALGLLLAVAPIAGSLAAQCADGSAPPCGAPAQRAVGRTVAVLYFDNLSPDTADAYLADGVTEELIVRIGRVQRLAVSSRYAVRRFRGRPLEYPAALGRDLNVNYLVTGSVRRSGDHVRVTAELMQAATGARVWGEVFDREERDLLALQTDLASDVATGIIGRLAPAERTTIADRPTRSPVAYEHFLRGNYALAERSPSSTVTALAEYQAALRVDPGYSAARARAAFAYALFPAWGWNHPTLSSDTLLARGLAAADAVLRQDSASSDAWMAYGLLLWLLHPRTFQGVIEAQQRAVTLDSGNAEALNLLGVTLANVGRDSAAAAAFRQALMIEPGRPISLMRLAEIDFLAGRAEQARNLLDSAVTVAPGFHYAYLDRAWVLLRLGNVTAARADAETALRLAPDDYEAARGVLAATQAATGDTLHARAGLDSLVAPFDRGAVVREAQVWNIAMPLVALGDTARALALIERARPRGAMLWWNLRWPEFGPLRAAPRLQRVFDESDPTSEGH